ncbi:MAG: ATPase, partial [Bacteroidetes bacterium 4484_276]
MLIKFTVGNFLSFYKNRSISFEAKGISELKQNVVKINNQKLLRSAVVYGANSSGKSNLLKAMDRMRDCVLNSVKLNDSDELDFSPFLLSKKSEDEPTFFEVTFLYQDKRFRYGFEYNLNEIVNEWLYVGTNTKNESPLFIRTIEGIGVTDKFKE